MLEKDVQEKPGGNVSLRDAKELGCCQVWGGMVSPNCIKLRGLKGSLFVSKWIWSRREGGRRLGVKMARIMYIYQYFKWEVLLSGSVSVVAMEETVGRVCKAKSQLCVRTACWMWEASIS